MLKSLISAALGYGETAFEKAVKCGKYAWPKMAIDPSQTHRGSGTWDPEWN